MTDDKNTDDAAARAAQFYEDGRLPVMNWPIRRPAERPGPPKTKATPYILKKGLYGQMPPRLSTVDQLIDYEIAVICASCDQSEPVDLPKFMAKGGRKSFQHLVTDLTCEACGGQLKSIEIYRTKDIPQADYPRQIYENPMCGRYTFTKSVDEIRGLFGFFNTPNLAPRYNIAPSQMVPAVAAIGDERKLGMMRWGLIPSWAKDAKIGFSNINARVETVAEKPAFRSAFKARHCLILADGFYEWEAEGKPKQPWRFTLPDGGAFAFAGLWEKWKDPAGEEIVSCTLITGEPFKEVAPVHDRSPVILQPEAYADWLACKRSEPSTYLGVPQYHGPLRAYKVSPALNNAKDNDHPGLIEPMEVQA